MTSSDAAPRRCPFVHPVLLRRRRRGRGRTNSSQGRPHRLALPIRYQQRWRPAPSLCPLHVRLAELLHLRLHCSAPLLLSAASCTAAAAKPLHSQQPRMMPLLLPATAPQKGRGLKGLWLQRMTAACRCRRRHCL